jgi:hypothetical protein
LGASPNEKAPESRSFAEILDAFALRLNWLPQPDIGQIGL